MEALQSANRLLKTEAIKVARAYLRLAAMRRSDASWHAGLLHLAADRRRHAAFLSSVDHSFKKHV